jgi:hypothetical protein
MTDREGAEKVIEGLISHGWAPPSEAVSLRRGIASLTGENADLRNALLKMREALAAGLASGERYLCDHPDGDLARDTQINVNYLHDLRTVIDAALKPRTT